MPRAARFIMGDVRLLPRLAVLIVALGGSTACATLHARTKPDGPPLDTPAPPPRAIVPAEVGTQAPVAPAVRRSTQEAPPASAPATAIAPASPPPADASTRTLQTTANSGEAEQKVRALLTNAARDLSRIDYRRLGADARSQYDFAKRFSEQAEDAMRARNFVFAEQLADKAASLAALLLKR